MLRIRRISKEYYLRQIMACWLVCYMALGIPAQIALAPPPVLPQGWELVTGSADVPDYTTTAGTMYIRNIANGTIFKWNDGFNISSLGTADFQFIVNGSAVMNRDVTGNMSEIYGTLTANGNVWIINPAGIVFGSSATINVTQLVASSLDIDNADFINGLPYMFTGGLNAGDVTNEGSITAERIALIAKNVINRGALVADECVIMAAGDTVLISENSPVTVEVTMGAGVPSDFVVNNHEDGDGIQVDGDTAQVILAAGDIWSAALIKAYSDGGSDAVATVDIDAAGDITVTDKVVAEAAGNGENNATATVTVNSGGDVKVIGDGHEGKPVDYKALIQAKTQGGMTNTSEVLICADGYLTVEAEGEWFDTSDWPHGNIAAIEAIAQSGDSRAQSNTADVKIGAKEGIEVISASGIWTESSASIAAYADGGAENTAGVVACTEGGVQVIDVGGGETPNTAKIVAEALNGHTTDAYVGICAVDDVVVAASEDGTAMIKAKAAPYLDTFVTLNKNQEPTSANAEVSVVSHEGGVAVVDVGELGETAKIVAEAYNAYSNTASVGVAAENVTVQALGEGSLAYILSYAHNGFENTADTVVCAPGEVTVINADGCIAKIAAVAVNGELNTATTQVYASDVTVSDDGIAFIGSIAGGDVLYVPEPGDDGFCLTEDGKVAWTEGGAVLIIGDYGVRQDCPDCPPCPCEEEEEDLFAPVAPLAQFQIPRIEGCPELMQAAAAELGIAAETLQVAIGNALALNPSIQPCEACATLVNAAAVLRDEDGSRMAATVQVFNELAPADAPFTPEMATSIAMAFGGAAEGTQYASVMEYIDAFVQYATVLDIELGSPVGDSVAFVMDKYGTGITGSDNGNIAAFVATRLETIGE